jgi:hypothetical protein
MNLAHVGVTQVNDPERLDTHLKRYALFFDRIRIIYPPQLTDPPSKAAKKSVNKTTKNKTTKKMKDVPPWLNSMAFLHNQGFVHFAEGSALSVHFAEASALSDRLQELDAVQAELYQDAHAKARKGALFTALQRNLGKELREEFEAGVYASWITRFEAIHMRLFERCDAVSLGALQTEGLDKGSVDRPTSRDDLYEIIVEGVPIAHEKVPWEDILRFRADEESQRQQRALRLWIADTAKGKLNFAEAVDKIEHLKDEYRTHIKGSGFKVVNGVLKTCVVATADLLESAIKLKLKSLAELPFRLTESKAELMEAERKAPGRELAYAVRAQRAFA